MYISQGSFFYKETPYCHSRESGNHLCFISGFRLKAGMTEKILFFKIIKKRLNNKKNVKPDQA